MISPKIQYKTSMPTDPFAGFRQELAGFEQARAEREARAGELAALIENADRSSMFGRDYSYASQWANHLSQNIDEFAKSEEGVARFKNATQQLKGFIESREQYKKDNFGTAKDDPKMGTFMGSYKRETMGGAFKFENDFIDEKFGTKEYAIDLAKLEQPIAVAGFDENALPVDFEDYLQSTPVDPFMPRLKPGKIKRGYDFYDAVGPNKRHSSEKEAADWAMQEVLTDESLKREAARDYVRKEKESNPFSELDVDFVLRNETHRDAAFQAWADDAGSAWVDLDKPTPTKPTQGDKDRVRKREALKDSSYIPTYAIDPRSVQTVVDPMNVEATSFPSIHLTEGRVPKLDVTDLIPAQFREKEVTTQRGFDEPIVETVPFAVQSNPKTISIVKDGTGKVYVELAGLYNDIERKEIPNVYLDIENPEHQAKINELNAILRSTYADWEPGQPTTVEAMIETALGRVPSTDTPQPKKFNG